MNARFFLAEGLRSIRSNSAIAISAVITTLLTLSILATVLVTYQYVSSTFDNETGRLDIRTSIRDDASIAQRDALEARIKGAPNVASYRFVTKEEGLAETKKLLNDPSITDELGGSPLPAEFRIKPNDANNAQSIIDRIVGDPALLTLKDDKTGEIVDTGITYGGKGAQTLIRIANFIKWAGLVIVIALLVASIFLIANTIQLSIFARRREVEVMKLVGATNWHIRWPFIIEGIICGIGGAILAIALLAIGKATVLTELTDLFRGGLSKDSAKTVSFPMLALGLLGAGAGVGALGSGLTLRRFLRV